MTHTPYIWADGQLRSWNDVTIPVITHALHYGTSVFEGVRVYPTRSGAAIFRLEDHLKRLLYSAHTLQMVVPYSLAELVQATVALLEQNQLRSGYIRPLITYGEDHMSLLTDVQTPVHVYLAAWPWPSLLGDQPLRVQVSSWRRIPPTSSDPAAKVGGLYVTSTLATRAAQAAGYDEAIMLDQSGYLAEGPGENVFFVRDGVVYTPQTGSLLPGITRDSIMTMCRDQGLTVREVQWLPTELATVQEGFFTGTAAEVAPIASVDDIQFSKSYGPVTRQLHDQYLRIVQGEDDRYLNWLTQIHV
jgi:branched-chain amino acid aminotransferase